MIHKKLCNKCKEIKSLSHFGITKRHYIRRRCNECRELKPPKQPEFVNLKLKMRWSEYKGIRQAAMNRGYAVGKYIVLLHKNNVKKRIF